MDKSRALELWTDTVSFLKGSGRQNHSSLDALLSTIQVHSLTDDELILETGSKYTKDWIERFLAPDLKEATWAVSGKQLAVRIVFQPDLEIVGQTISSPVVETSRASAVSAVYSPPASLDTRPVTSNNLALALENEVIQAPAAVAVLTPTPAPITPSPTTTVIKTIPGVFSADISLSTPTSESAYGSSVAQVPTPISTQSTPQSSTQVSDLISKTFQSFVVGESNLMAFNMALQVAKTPGYIMNPLFIYGKSGLGKTHLLLSIHHYVKSCQPHLKTLYVQTSELIHEYSNSARIGDFSAFHSKYYSVDILLLDDVQLLENKIETTNTVFDIFNLLRSNNKQVVLSADRAPNEINLHERYLSRFNNGVIADVQPPSTETKLTILRNYLDYCSLRFEHPEVREFVRPDVEEFIVSLSGSNIRELEGAATSLIWYLSSSEKTRYLPLTIEEAEPVISHHFRRLEAKSVNIETIQKETENYFGIRHEDILGSQRSQNISYPRQIAMYLCRSLTGASYPYIGESFGGKDHTSVIYAYNNIEKRRQLSTKVENDIKQLLELIAG
jgi:chromosomal replication initiator protein